MRKCRYSKPLDGSYIATLVGGPTLFELLISDETVVVGDRVGLSSRYSCQTALPGDSCIFAMLSSDQTTLTGELNTVKKKRILTGMGSAPTLVIMRFFHLTTLLFQPYVMWVRLNSVFSSFTLAKIPIWIPVKGEFAASLEKWLVAIWHVNRLSLSSEISKTHFEVHHQPRFLWARIICMFASDIPWSEFRSVPSRSNAINFIMLFTWSFLTLVWMLLCR